MPLTSDRLARMRARALGYLSDSAVIEYDAATTNSAGAPGTPNWTMRGTVDCRLLVQEFAARGLSDVITEDGRLTTYTEYTLLLDVDETIQPGDRVTLEARKYRAESVTDADTDRAYKAAKLTLEGLTGG